MENMKPNETAEFMWRRLTEECPVWAIGVPVVFAFIVVALIVFFRQEKKLKAAITGLTIVGTISLVYLPLAFILRPMEFGSGNISIRLGWMVILIPVIAVALFYVGLMYLRDAKSVHPLWASFLGLLRCCVYVILAIVFLLPGCQHFEKQQIESMTLVLVDVSGSMFTVDDLPETGQDPATLPTRQDKILRFLLSKQDAAGREQAPFLERVAQKSPLVLNRFGPILDDSNVVKICILKKDKGLIAEADLKKWLFPSKADYPAPDVAALKEDVAKEKLAAHAKQLDIIDTLRSGTNLGGSCLSALKLENNSYIQAIIVISDGQSNTGSDDARAEFLARVSNPRKLIPVITVGVGQFRLPAAIRIEDILAPEQTQPDDKFNVRVPVVGTNLHDEEFTVTLEVKRVKDVTGKPVVGESFTLGPKKG